MKNLKPLALSKKRGVDVAYQNAYHAENCLFCQDYSIKINYGHARPHFP